MSCKSHQIPLLTFLKICLPYRFLSVIMSSGGTGVINLGEGQLVGMRDYWGGQIGYGFYMGQRSRGRGLLLPFRYVSVSKTA